MRKWMNARIEALKKPKTWIAAAIVAVILVACAVFALKL